MKITKKPFSTEVEITPEELRSFIEYFKPNDGVWEWICELIGINKIK